MKCPVCTETGQTSLVSSEPAPPTDVKGIEYWDDDEKLHVHDPACHTRKFQCTNGHPMLMLQFDSCPSCEYNKDRTILMTEDREKKTVSKYRFTKSKEWKKVVTFDGE